MNPITIPILPSSDFDATSGFYASLGFEERMRWPGDYLIMVHGLGIEVHFWLDSKLRKAKDAAGCYVRFDGADDVRSLHAEWENGLNGHGRVYPLVETDYGLLEFAIHDPHNNQIRFGGETS